MRRRSVLVVGPGFRFLGGLSVYTCSLVNALAASRDVSLIVLDRLIPARLYPGGARVGQPLTSLSYDPRVDIVGRINWYWLFSVVPTLRRMVARRPDVIVLQWWTAATMHTYLLLALVARLARIPVTMEFHEVQDTGEADVPGVAAYARATMPLLLRLVSGAIVHNEHDLHLLRATYGRGLDRISVEIAPHGPYDHLESPTPTAAQPGRADGGPVELLCFGLIRPYKGTEDAVAALEQFPVQDHDFHLAVVGETWENFTVPATMIAESPAREKISFVNRYVSDDEAAQFFAAADAVVLPYRRGSASGPLQIAMSHGLWVILYAVGGLVEAVRDYEGAILVEPGDVAGLAAAMRRVQADPSRRFADPHSWETTGEAIDRLADRVRV